MRTTTTRLEPAPDPPAARDLSRLPPVAPARACQAAGRAEAGLELFRRAIGGRDDGAWEALMLQYRGLVRAWIRQHPARVTVLAGEAVDYWVDRAFERFWQAVRPGRLECFPDLPRLLAYLKLCAHSVLLDEVRSRRARAAVCVESFDAGDAVAGWSSAGSAAAPDAEALAIRRLAGRDLWNAIAGALPDEAERLVISLSFAAGLRPREIYARYPDRYAGVAAVYRCKHTALDRLRRDPALQQFVA